MGETMRAATWLSVISFFLSGMASAGVPPAPPTSCEPHPPVDLVISDAYLPDSVSTPTFHIPEPATALQLALASLAFFFRPNPTAAGPRTLKTSAARIRPQAETRPCPCEARHKFERVTNYSALLCACPRLTEQ
jgi:hypothetical protein